MNRQIKFRLWNNKNKSWIHAPRKEVNLLGETIILGGLLDGVSIKDLNDIQVLQFTGFLDKNNNEIYEGDIFRICIDDDPECLEWELYTVIFYNGCFVFKDYKEPLHDFLEKEIVDGEVVGNIFDNPELLR